MYNDPNQQNLNQPNPNQGPDNTNQPIYNSNQFNQPYNPENANQFNQPYNPAQGYPPQQPPKVKHTKRNLGIGCLALIVVIALCGIISVATNRGTTPATTQTNTTTQSTTSAATPAATPKPLTWQTVKKISGNGSQKTDSFTVPGTWKLLWSCDPNSFGGGQITSGYNVIATINNPSDDSIVDTGINATCKAGTTSGSTNVTDGGTVRLDVISEGDWTFTAQAQK